MLSATAEIFDLYLGLRHAVLCNEEGQRLEAMQGTPAQTLGCIERTLRANKRWRKPQLRIRLSGALARPFLCGPAEGLKSWGEARQLAASLAPEATGILGPCRVTLDHWPAMAAELAVAVHAPWIAELERWATEAGVRLSSVKPWWVDAFGGLALAGSGLLVASEDDSMTLVEYKGDALASARSLVPADGSSHAVSVIKRVVAGLEVPDDAIQTITWPGQLWAWGDYLKSLNATQ